MHTILLLDHRNVVHVAPVYALATIKITKLNVLKQIQLLVTMNSFH